MLSDTLDLISYEMANDEYGVQVKTAVTKTVYCQVSSVTRNEFFQASQTGLHPTFEFYIRLAEYSGQTDIKYRGRLYHVYRTYMLSNDTIELSVEERSGDHS